MATANKKENPHKDHRQRMKRQFLRDGIDVFEPHQVLEMMLFYTIPQKDTNELAHRLLDRFGDLPSVLDADFGELCEVKGVSEHTATFLILTREVLSRYYKEKTDTGFFNDESEIVKYLQRQYMNEERERVRMLCLNNEGKLLDSSVVFTGTLTASLISVRDMVRIALRYPTTAIVVAHNHPAGNCLPSPEDIQATKDIAAMFRAMNIKVLDHYIFAGERYFSMRSNPLYAPVFSGTVERLDNQLTNRQ